MKQATSIIIALFEEALERRPTAQEMQYYTNQLLFYRGPDALLRIRNQILNVPRATRPENPVKVIYCNDVPCRNSGNTENIQQLKNAKILVVGLMRNVEPNLCHTRAWIDDLRKHVQLVCCYFYHNNSSDASQSLLKDWIENDPMVDVHFAETKKIQVLDASNNRLGNRIPEFAKMRNANVTMALERFGEDFDYVIMANTDLVEPIPVAGILQSLTFEECWDIICGNCTFQKSRFHYDNFALRLPGEPDDIREIYPGFEKYYGKSSAWLDKLYAFEGWTRVKSGYGDTCIFRSSSLLDVLNTHEELCDVRYDLPHVCELVSMCKKFQNVWVSPMLRYDATVSVERILYNEPRRFIPRDAGFFSVLNFYIGSLVNDPGRLYPDYRKSSIIQHNAGNGKSLLHFCYCEENDENAWMQYFLPVQFYKGDTEHGDCSYDAITQGHEADATFRMHTTYGHLMRPSNRERFSQWRAVAHGVYRRHVTPIKKLVVRVEDFWKTIRCQYIIGVHYRHPSHNVEQGDVLFSDYFKAIDAIMQTKEDASVFLATDCEFAVACFKHRYHTVYTLPDVKRLPMDNVLQWGMASRRRNAFVDDMGFVNGTGYQLHYTQASSNTSGGVKAGQDVLSEAMCLARCDHVVHTISNVALAVSYMNPSVEMTLVTDASKYRE